MQRYRDTEREKLAMKETDTGNRGKRGEHAHRVPVLPFPLATRERHRAAWKDKAFP